MHAGTGRTRPLRVYVGPGEGRIRSEWLNVAVQCNVA
jgi:hypothetical protein